MPGSLPMGGSVANTPIHTLTAPLQLPASVPGLTPRRHDIDLDGQLAFRVDGVLSREECDRIVEVAEGLGFRPEAPGIATPPGMRMNKSLHWVADEGLMGAIFARIGHLLPQELDGQRLHPRLSHRINMYKYDNDDVFNRHTDGDWPGYGLSADRRRMEQWAGVHSKLSLLLYLNGPEDGFAGGATRLYSPAGRVVDVSPSKGACLFFRHGHGNGSVMHEGSRVTGPVPKYVARINVLYDC